MIASFLSDTLVRGYLRWTGKRPLLALFQSLRHAGRPAEVAFPAELLEQGLSVVLAGLSNTLAVQSNPSWVWPYWVERQIDPDSDAFLPTGTNVIKNNLTARNWTSLGTDASEREAMIDPVGMITLGPYGWSYFPYLRVDGNDFLPPRLEGVRQQLLEETLPVVITRYPSRPELEWTSESLAVKKDGQEWLITTHRVRNVSERALKLAFGVAVRPYNPLMFSPILDLAYDEGVFRVNGKRALGLAGPPARVSLSNRRLGDPVVSPVRGLENRVLDSRSGMLAAVAEYDWEIPAGGERAVRSIGMVARRANKTFSLPAEGAIEALRAAELVRLRAAEGRGLRIEVPDAALEKAFRAVKGRLHVFDDGDHFSPGSFLYHAHWFRDAAFIALAFDQMGFGSRVADKTEAFLKRQDRSGFFLSQSGEWDSNGQALWTLIGHVQRGGDPALLERAWPRLMRGARWIEGMLRKGRRAPSPHFGLLPAGFSAEHFGPNDHYYWDNLWSLAGLEKLLWAARFLGRHREAGEIAGQLARYRSEVDASMRDTFRRAGCEGLPCSPYRGLDSAAIGNLVGVSPLDAVGAGAEWVSGTVGFLIRNNLRDGLFLQKIIHTGLNPYLSAQLARALLKRGDPRAFSILQAMLRHSGPTHAWPEAIHPRTRGGCMGDGDHGWAAAEFLNLVRDFLVREEGGALLLLSGAPETWFTTGAALGVSGAPTLHGEISFRVELGERSLSVEWKIERRPHQDAALPVLCLPLAYARSLGVAGEAHGLHLRVPLAEPSGKLFHGAPLSKESWSAVSPLRERSLHA